MEAQPTEAIEWSVEFPEEGEKTWISYTSLDLPEGAANSLEREGTRIGPGRQQLKNIRGKEEHRVSSYLFQTHLFREVSFPSLPIWND